MFIKNFRHSELNIENFATCPGQAWCLYGSNSSGINRFVDLLSGTLQKWQAEVLTLPQEIGIISFNTQQELFLEELRNDDSNFLDKIDPGTLVREFIPSHEKYRHLLIAFGLDNCLEVGYRQLSSGQSRKLLILRELLDENKLLLIQNPYDGLDKTSSYELDQGLQHAVKLGREVILCINTLTDIPSWVSYLAVIDKGNLCYAGPKKDLYSLKEFLGQPDRDSPAPLLPPTPPPPTEPLRQNEEIIFIGDGFAAYGSRVLFNGLNLCIHSGDHTLITGPNGCGKSTLLDIITGDNPKCYANNLRLFGKKRGTGETIWELKKHIGMVSPHLHRDHHVSGSALQIVISGLYDSIGLYRKAKTNEIRLANEWLKWLNLFHKANTPFRRLDFAEQRQILIARALIKGPKLLVLDEPTQGLDDQARDSILFVLEDIAGQKLSTVLYVSHRADEFRPFFRNHIQLSDYAPI